MSDERDRAGAPVDDAVNDDVGDGDTSGKTTAVVTRPQRPTGKRPRRDAGGDEVAPATEEKSSKNGDGTKKKAAKAAKSGPSRNPILFVINYLKQVIAELRKVIWPNRKQMISYTTVVLIFLVFMVALIGGVDFGLAKLISLVFG